uniref:Uncharacterized protein n=1 Tax=Arundo donax TaxID=35708 RepID=A0A0A8ZDI5_ARUDO
MLRTCDYCARRSSRGKQIHFTRKKIVCFFRLYFAH